MFMNISNVLLGHMDLILLMVYHRTAKVVVKHLVLPAELSSYHGYYHHGVKLKLEKITLRLLAQDCLFFNISISCITFISWSESVAIASSFSCLLSTVSS